jgi:apolipoprotein D and lipocalin family protein
MFSRKKIKHTNIIVPTFALLLLCSTQMALAESTTTAPKNGTVTSMKNFDLNRYLGRWYEIARLPMMFNPHCKTDIYSTYSLTSDSKIKVDNQCLQTDGKTIHIVGTATIDKVIPSKLDVSFLPAWANFLSFGKLKYKFSVIDTDYKTALTGGSDHKYLWILSRTPQIDPATYKAYVEQAQREGFDTSKLIVNK